MWSQKYTLSSAVVCHKEGSQHAVILSIEHWELGESVLCQEREKSSIYPQHSLSLSAFITDKSTVPMSLAVQCKEFEEIIQIMLKKRILFRIQS